jgi:endonuclease/exonuclease/phosphatase family metal-dependent hydrolase
MHGAIASSESWNYLLELSPDIALLQEVNAMPMAVTERYSEVGQRASRQDGQQQRFSTFVLVGEGECVPEALRSDVAWVDDELGRFAGNLVSTRVRLGSFDLRVVSVYSPAWPISRDRLAGIDISAVQFRQYTDVWLADLIWAVLPARPTEAWIVGGDFNLSETFDAWRDGPRGHREYFERLTTTGYADCLRTATGRLTPTFRNPRGGGVRHQLDHLFVSAPLLPRLLTCDVGSTARVFEGGLSDHLPLVADFAD